MRIWGTLCIIAISLCSSLVSITESSAEIGGGGRFVFEPRCPNPGGAPAALNADVEECFWEYAAYLIPEDALYYQYACLGETYDGDDCKNAISLVKDHWVTDAITNYCCLTKAAVNVELTEPV